MATGALTVLVERRAIVGDWDFPGDILLDADCCFLDDAPLVSDTDFLRALIAGRLADIEGAFAVVWRDGRGVVRMARDALGERTLYYATLGDRLYFASHLRELFAWVPRRLHLPAVAAFLSYAYVPGRQTLVQGVYELLPGEVREADSGRKFWTLPAEPAHYEDEETLRVRLRSSLETAVQRRHSHVATLSGGIDSSLVVALARPTTTLSVSFGEGYANELPFSALMAKHVGAKHHIVEISPQRVLTHLDHSISLLSSPIGDPLTVPNALLFDEARQYGDAVLNGEGGDPCFGGPKNLPMVLSDLYGGQQSREAAYLRAHGKCFDELKDVLVQHEHSLEADLRPWFEDPLRPSFVGKLMAINVGFKGAHHILTKVDQISAGYGVTPRSPLFDRRIVELSFAIPPQLKLRGSIEKYLLKRAVEDIVPRAIIDRPKSGMLVPVEGWFSGPLLGVARERLLDGLTRFEVVQRAYLERLLDGRVGGIRPRRGVKIWLLLTLEAWLRTVLFA